jgi:hypothetical protein
MLRKREGDAVTEYAVDPAQVAVALAAKITFDTGLISGDTLLVRQEGVKKTVVEYRKAQLTGVFLDGSETALRVPLPPLLMIRVTNENRSPSYGVYAVKRRPASLDVKLFQTPLPNVFNSGSICWGSVQRVSDTALTGTSLAEDWSQLLGSSFGDHYVELIWVSSRFQSSFTWCIKLLTDDAPGWAASVKVARGIKLPAS